jgi:hypothetical protein
MLTTTLLALTLAGAAADGIRTPGTVTGDVSVHDASVVRINLLGWTSSGWPYVM